MLHVNKRETTSNRFSNLFKQLEQSDTYHIDAAKLEISEQIYLAMEQQGVTNAELARRLGKSRAYITKVLQGNVNFTIESLVKIARALGHKFDFQFAPENQKGGAARQARRRFGAWDSRMERSADNDRIDEDLSARICRRT